MLTKVNEIQARTILTKTSLPGSDYVVNPYNGCQFACMYCYAAQIARWHHPGEEWGSFLDVKVNAPELLKNELIKMSCREVSRNVSTQTSKNFGSIFFSSVTDPYLGLEAKYQLTRRCLQILADFGYEGKVSLQTKSSLVTRDIDIISRLKDKSVGFTVTTLNDDVSRFLEVQAPPVSARLEAIKQIHQSGIPVYAFVGPVLPHYLQSKDKINELLDRLEEAGVDEVWFEHIHLNNAIKTRLFSYLKEVSPGLLPAFQVSDSVEYRQKLESIIYGCLKGRHLKLGLGKIIYHRDLPKKT